MATLRSLIRLQVKVAHSLKPILLSTTLFAPNINQFSSGPGLNVGLKTNIAAMSDDWKNATSVYDFTANDIKGNPVSLDTYKGHVLLIVNVASKCGLTETNYKELVELDEKFREKGLRILAFPCNQFNNQEPLDSEGIVCFMQKKNATFDMFEKIEVNGDGAHPLWKYLKLKQGGTLTDGIKWNFTKFIVDKNGQPVERHGPMTSPSKLASNIEKYL